MCGRYQFTEPQNADLRRILQDVRRRCGDRAQDFRFGDVMPTAAAPVLIANGGKVVADLQTWGIPGWKGGLMINARAETVCEKPMFRRSMAAQRCVIPATSFYEWDAARHKYQFALPGEPLYLAGLYDNVDGANRFVILTTTPNASMHGIHDRMPLILTREQGIIGSRMPAERRIFLQSRRRNWSAVRLKPSSAFGDFPSARQFRSARSISCYIDMGTSVKRHKIP